MFCKTCRNRLDAHVKFCIKCGAPVNTSVPPALRARPTRRGRSTYRAILLLGIAAAMVLVAAAALIVWSGAYHGPVADLGGSWVGTPSAAESEPPTAQLILKSFCTFGRASSRVHARARTQVCTSPVEIQLNPTSAWAGRISGTMQLAFYSGTAVAPINVSERLTGFSLGDRLFIIGKAVDAALGDGMLVDVNVDGATDGNLITGTFKETIVPKRGAHYNFKSPIILSRAKLASSRVPTATHNQSGPKRATRKSVILPRHIVPTKMARRRELFPSSRTYPPAKSTLPAITVHVKPVAMLPAQNANVRKTNHVTQMSNPHRSSRGAIAPQRATASAPCGVVDFEVTGSATYNASTDYYERNNVVAIVHYANGTTQSVPLDWPWRYKSERDDPFSPLSHVPMLFQFPPRSQRTSEPPAVQYLMAHTSASGMTTLNEHCPKLQTQGQGSSPNQPTATSGPNG